MEMATKRVLAASAAILGAGGSLLALPADPAGAHETERRMLDAVSTVGAGHSGIRVCSLMSEGYTATARYRSPGQSQIKSIAVTGSGCNSRVDPAGIAEHQLCLSTRTERLCTTWKST
jgi:hypothetical protein